VLGLLTYAAMNAAGSQHQLIAAADAFFGIYLLLAGLALGKTSEDLRIRASVEDEGMALVFLIVLAALSFSCGSVIIILHQSRGVISVPLILALASAPLGWFTLHVVAAFHYANLYYRMRTDRDAGESASPPLLFPGNCEPAAWDFMYYALVIGMTAQVSDVQVTDTKLRRATAGHSVVSFFFNTVLLAMAVNAVVTIAS
jgi:uncharacterized membrane protein